MTKFAIPILAAAGLALSAAGASAQSIGVEIGPSYGYSNFDGYGRGYSGRYYGYRSVAPARRYYGPSYGYRSDETTVTRRGRGGGCGTYFYWEGGRCVDARNK